MRSIIAKFAGRYLLWSQNTDRPVTSLMTAGELRDFVMRSYGYEELKELPERMERADRFGTSSRTGTRTASLLEHNTAGPKGGRVASEEAMVALYGGDTVAHWEQNKEPELDFAKPLELFDYTGFDPVVLKVVEVVSVREGAAFVLVQLPDSEERYPVLLRASDGEVLSAGYKYLAARNGPA